MLIEMAQSTPCRPGSTAPFVGCGHRFYLWLLHSQELERASGLFLSFPFHKMGRSTLPPQKLLVTRSSSAPDCCFSFPLVSLLHSSEWWPSVAMVTPHRVMLLRNNDNWWQQGSRARMVISLWGVPRLGREATKEAVLGIKERMGGELNLINWTRMLPVSSN